MWDLFYPIDSHLQTGGAACEVDRTQIPAKIDPSRSHGSAVRNQDPMPVLREMVRSK